MRSLSHSGGDVAGRTFLRGLRMELELVGSHYFGGGSPLVHVWLTTWQ